jgi:hypothetical protein
MLLVPATTNEETLARIYRLFPDTRVAKSSRGVIIDRALLKRD